MIERQLYRRPPDPGGYIGGYRWGPAVGGIGLLVLCNIGATQWIAQRFAYHAALGPPLFRVDGIEGSLQTRQFTPKDGSQRTIYEVVVRSCHLVEPARTKHEIPASNEPAIDYASVAEGSGGASNDGEWPV